MFLKRKMMIDNVNLKKLFPRQQQQLTFTLSLSFGPFSAKMIYSTLSILCRTVRAGIYLFRSGLSLKVARKNMMFQSDFNYRRRLAATESFNLSRPK